MTSEKKLVLISEELHCKETLPKKLTSVFLYFRASKLMYEKYFEIMKFYTTYLFFILLELLLYI